jgi:uncharacterized protein YprB with RNaseH-like and TPR domain
MSVWTSAANEALKDHLDHESWPAFQQAFPDITYDAWEVKRRRYQKNHGITQVPVVHQLEQIPGAGEYVGPSILYFDIETTFSTRPRMLCGAGVDALGRLTVFDQRDYAGRSDWTNDRDLVVAYRDYLESFSIVCGWNSKLFDVPVINGRLRLHRERPLRLQMHCDLMYYAGGQFMRIGSKALQKVSEYFDSPHRKTPLVPEIHDRADHGSEEDMDLIIEHNIADVYVTRDVADMLWPMVRVVHRAG